MSYVHLRKISNIFALSFQRALRRRVTTIMVVFLGSPEVVGYLRVPLAGTVEHLVRHPCTEQRRQVKHVT